MTTPRSPNVWYVVYGKNFTRREIVDNRSMANQRVESLRVKLGRSYLGSIIAMRLKT